MLTDKCAVNYIFVIANVIDQGKESNLSVHDSYFFLQRALAINMCPLTSDGISVIYQVRKIVSAINQ